MALIEMKVPSPGESITEVQIARWLKKDGDTVEKDEELCEIDSDKATLTLNAEASGTLKITAKEGETVAVGSVVCTIDDSGVKDRQSISNSQQSETKQSNTKEEKKQEAVNGKQKADQTYASGTPSVSAEKLMKENSVKKEDVIPTGKAGRITKADVLEKINSKVAAKLPDAESQLGNRSERREKMSMLRKRVGERLVAVKQETAMLTTFNEVDMSAIMNIRKLYKDKFKDAHGINLGFMSFFTRAVCEALKNFPAVNAQIDGDEIIYHDYCDIGIAVSAPKGLMVPVIRNAESLSFAQVEQRVSELATKARDGKISIDEMTGGTFTITNGGVFGSMLSTPIINPSQSAILGMHNIVERPVALNGKVVIRPVMYVALSYDHRIIDGRESVSFLVRVKQMLEEPISMLIEGNNPVKTLLNL
jgi:2-oxoglutarate dehydrogenase E2 component (dihydrolipoamide succinyltransferase)